MTAPMSRPVLSRIGAAESCTEISWPRRLTSSAGSGSSTFRSSRRQRRIGLSIGVRVTSFSTWKTSDTGRPTASAEVQPVSCSATGFRYSTRASASAVSTASPIDCSVTWAFSFSSARRISASLRVADVRERAFVAGDLPVLVAQDARIFEHRDHAAVTAAQLVLGTLHPPVAVQGRDDTLPVGRVHVQ